MFFKISALIAKIVNINRYKPNKNFLESLIFQEKKGALDKKLRTLP